MSQRILLAGKPIPIGLLLLILTVFSSSPAVCQETVSLTPYFRNITLTGFTYPLTEMTVTSEVSGRCLAVFADIGDTLSADGRLAEIDTTFIQLDIAANRIAKEQTARQLAQEEKNLARYTTLLNQSSVPQAQLDDVALAADLHKIELKKLANNEHRLQEQLERHYLTAPAGWQMIERFAEPGEVIRAGEPVARLGDFRRLRIQYAATYDELQTILGQDNPQLYLPDLQLHVSATIHRTSPVFDPESRKIQVELLIRADNDQRLRGGMRAELQFASDKKTGTFLVPTEALIGSYEANWLVQPDRSRVQVILQGYSEDRRFAIISGNGLRLGQLFLATPNPSGQ